MRDELLRYLMALPTVSLHTMGGARTVALRTTRRWRSLLWLYLL